MKHVTIVGGGWAGLAAAVELSKHNIPVHLYEASKQLGGRARSLKKDDMVLDNGQHLMIGAYWQLLDLLNTIGVNEQAVLLRTPQQLQMFDTQRQSAVFELALPRLPAPLHLLVGMLRCPSLTLKEKFTTLLRFDRLLKTPIKNDLSVDQWLENAQLPAAYVQYLLKPLCLAALTTHTHEASARAFQTVLNQTFNGPAGNTDLLFGRQDLGHIFPDAAHAYIESKGGRVYLQHRVTDISLDQNRASAIHVGEQSIAVNQLILATPAHITARLLAAHTATQSIAQQLEQLKYEPVTTVYLQYPAHIQLPLPMIGVLNATTEWLFDRQHCGQPGLIASIISAGGPHMAMDKPQLAAEVSADIAQLFPNWPAPLITTVIREKKATLRCHPDVDQKRPNSTTAVNQLWLCGDYVYIEENNQPGLPSTLEGAVRSGVKCAQQLISTCYDQKS